MPLNSKLKFILEIAILLGTAAGMAIIISFGITAYLGGSAHPTVAVTTGSMLPIYNGFQDDTHSEIHPFRGDILLVRKVPVESIELGDVIVFNTSSVPEPVVHRIIDKWFENNSYHFKTNGDNNDFPDQWVVSGKDVIGVVVLRLPHVGWFLLVIQTTAGKILILALVILLLFVGDDSEEEKNPEEKKDQKFSPSKVGKTKLQKSKDIAFKTIQSKKRIYSILILLIFSTFISGNLISATISSPSVSLYSYSTGTGERIDNLLKSTESSPYTISTSNKWDHGENATQTAYFFPILIEIRSGGLLNNIEKIEIITQANGTEGLYRWTIVYNFVGSRVLEGGIVAFLDGAGTFDATITLSVSSRGLFASPDQSLTFPLVLQSR
ncbi:MAG: signal peptidase I [Candidatus Hodarchaeota archaeon]